MRECVQLTLRKKDMQNDLYDGNQYNFNPMIGYEWFVWRILKLGHEQKWTTY